MTMQSIHNEPASAASGSKANGRNIERAAAGRGGKGAGQRHLRVFILEDELMLAWDLEATVEGMGYEVCGIASNSADAIKNAVKSEADLVLADINLGEEIDGIETARRIKAEHEAQVIFISAYSDSATAQRAAELVPGSTLLGKPLSERQLAEAIQRAFPAT